MHNPMFDEKGRVWFTSRVRPPRSGRLQEGSDHPSAKLFPVEQANRHLSMYDPKTGKSPSSARASHPSSGVRGRCEQHVVTSAGGPQSGVLGWLNRKLFEETGDEMRSQGWTALVLDTNGNGKRDDYVEPDQPVDPPRTKRIVAAFYGIAVTRPTAPSGARSLDSPATSSVSIRDRIPGDRSGRGLRAAAAGYGPRGMDIDRKRRGVGHRSRGGHLASFDRHRCKGPLNGPTATGRHCPEGWTLYPFPGPQLQGVTESGSAEASYYTWVDQHDYVRAGQERADGYRQCQRVAHRARDGAFVNLRVPYPMGFYASGWMGASTIQCRLEGKGLWSTYATRTPFHVEGGKGTTSKVVKFSFAPDPLAR